MAVAVLGSCSLFSIILSNAIVLRPFYSFGSIHKNIYESLMILLLKAQVFNVSYCWLTDPYTDPGSFCFTSVLFSEFVKPKKASLRQNKIQHIIYCELNLCVRWYHHTMVWVDHFMPATQWHKGRWDFKSGFVLEYFSAMCLAHIPRASYCICSDVHSCLQQDWNIHYFTCAVVILYCHWQSIWFPISTPFMLVLSSNSLLIKQYVILSVTPLERCELSQRMKYTEDKSGAT